MDPKNLTVEEVDFIIEEIMQDPVEAVSYPESKWDEDCGGSNTWYFGVIQCDDGIFATFSVDDDERRLVFGASFDNQKEARESAGVWAYETEESAKQDLEDSKEMVELEIAFLKKKA